MSSGISARSRTQQQWADSLSKVLQWQIKHHPGWRQDAEFFPEARLTAADHSSVTAHLCASRDADGQAIVEAWVVAVTDDELTDLTARPAAYAAIRERCDYAWVLGPMGWHDRFDRLPAGWGLCVNDRTGFLFDAVKPSRLRT